MSPQEHDEELLRLEGLLRQAERALSIAERTLRVRQGQRRRNGVWTIDGTEAVLVPDESLLLKRQALDEIVQEIARHEDSYSGWSRFRLVISSDGHVHGDAACRTFKQSTRTLVIPALSGKEPSDAVEMLGESCCSVCVSGAGASAVKVPASLVNILLRRGTSAFEEAARRRNDLTSRRPATIMSHERSG